MCGPSLTKRRYAAVTVYVFSWTRVDSLLGLLLGVELLGHMVTLC